jgi:hypothetical protein
LGILSVVFAQETAEVKLDATMDKKKLATGTCLMNVVANDKTTPELSSR